jgi:hypothetical protein
MHFVLIIKCDPARLKQEVNLAVWPFTRDYCQTPTASRI